MSAHIEPRDIIEDGVELKQTKRMSKAESRSQRIHSHIMLILSEVATSVNTGDRRETASDEETTYETRGWDHGNTIDQIILG